MAWCLVVEDVDDVRSIESTVWYVYQREGEGQPDVQVDGSTVTVTDEYNLFLGEVAKELCNGGSFGRLVIEEKK